MAGDLNINEYAVVLASHARMGNGAAAEPGSFIHRYGDRVLIGPPPTAGRPGAQILNPAVQVIPHSLMQGLSLTERLGLEALQYRMQPHFLQAKQNRPRDGEVWDMGGCAGAAQQLPAEAMRAMQAYAQAPTSAYLEGSVAVGIVIVEGPTADLQFSAEERTKVVAEVQNGLSWLASVNPLAGINFTYDIQVVTLTVAPDPHASDLEALWRDPAMAALGFEGSWNGVVQYVESLRQRFQTRWTYCGYFTKYPLGWFAYASIGGPRLVMDYNNDGWGPDNIDRVFAHESGHVFGCPDEYASSGCDCGGAWGRFGRPNSNCENCAPGGGVVCLMKGNTFAMCSVTPAHLGWMTEMPAVRGTPVLVQSRFGQQGNFELVTPASTGGINFSWRNNDDPELPWAPTSRFSESLGAVDAITMIQSNFGDPGNLELIARVGEQLYFLWRDSGPAFQWNGPWRLTTVPAGAPLPVVSGPSLGTTTITVPHMPPSMRARL